MRESYGNGKSGWASLLYVIMAMEVAKDISKHSERISSIERRLVRSTNYIQSNLLLKSPKQV